MGLDATADGQLMRRIGVASLILLAGLLLLVAMPSGPSPILSTVSPPLPKITPEPATDLLDKEGRGSLRWTSDLVAGRYGVRWLETAGQAACERQVLLDGPSGRVTVSGVWHLEPQQSESSVGESEIASPGGRYILTLVTDCPGPSHLWAWRYLLP